MADQHAPGPVVSASAWAPLRRPLFRALWIATVVSSIGTWMHEVGAGWLMVTLNPSPVMVSLVQAATVPELVSREELQPAVALNSIGINVARAIGPALLAPCAPACATCAQHPGCRR